MNLVFPDIISTRYKESPTPTVASPKAGRACDSTDKSSCWPCSARTRADGRTAPQGATWAPPCTRCTWSGHRWSTRAPRHAHGRLCCPRRRASEASPAQASTPQPVLGPKVAQGQGSMEARQSDHALHALHALCAIFIQKTY